MESDCKTLLASFSLRGEVFLSAPVKEDASSRNDGPNEPFALLGGMLNGFVCLKGEKDALFGMGSTCGPG